MKYITRRALRRISKSQRDEFLSIVKKGRRKKITLRKICDIERLFVWSGTPQGADYWVNIHNHFSKFNNLNKETRNAERSKEITKKTSS